MDVFDFARRYLYPYNTKGDEIIPKLCPFCKGGAHNDKETFALNTVKETYICHRGSCGKQGHFSQLCKEFGCEADKKDNYELYKPIKQYKKPATVIKETSNAAELYLETRKISKATVDYYSVGCDENGNITFPYHENGELVMIKFRPSHKIAKGERKSWREEGGKPILWGMDLCTNELPLIITEGELDTMACYEAGLRNVVSVPSGSEDFTWVDLCWEWLQQFKKIILFGDSDEPGKEMVRKLILKLTDHDLYTVENKYKDANELLFYDGKEAVKLAIEQAKQVPVHGLVDLADVKPLDVSKIERVKSNISWIDKSIGGFLMGELSIWTGKRGQGKSTFLGQLLVESIQQDIKVCAYSGELRADRFQYWINLQIAGKQHISKYYDGVAGREVNYVKADVTEAIKSWYRSKFYLYDNSISSANTEESSILNVFKYAIKRYDCKVLLIDNLMTANFEFTNDKDYYRAQSNFVGQLKDFANKYNVHIHLVAHPKKTMNASLENDDVSGTGDITNRADNVFSLGRVTDTEKEETGCDVIFKIMKNRSDGIMNETVGLNYCNISRRLYVPSLGDIKEYGWSKNINNNQSKTFEQCPF